MTAEAQYRAAQRAYDRQIPPEDPPDCHVCGGSGWVVQDAGCLEYCPAKATDLYAERCRECAQ